MGQLFDMFLQSHNDVSILRCFNRKWGRFGLSNTLVLTAWASRKNTDFFVSVIDDCWTASREHISIKSKPHAS